MATLEEQIYNLIEDKAKSNIFIQGLSGIMGFPFTLFADVGVIFTHYGPMLNEIRTLYGRSTFDAESIKPILNGCTKELLVDLTIDKVIGQLPVVGFAANIICAKAMTWRLGILFAMLSSRGDEIDIENVRNATMLIREVFPQKLSLRFVSPSKNDVNILLNKVSNETVSSFNETIDTIRRILNDSPTFTLSDL